MNKKGKIALVLLVGLAAAGLSYYFLIWKPQHPKEYKPVLPPAPPKPPVIKTNKDTAVNTNPNTTPNIGFYFNKDAYAAFNTNVLNSDFSVYKTILKDELAGKVLTKETKYGKDFYRMEVAPAVYKYIPVVAVKLK